MGFIYNGGHLATRLFSDDLCLFSFQENLVISTLIDFILHIDQHLVEISAQYGVWIYAVLFLIIFCETGLVVTPFLPGDSLLFAAGGIAAVTSLG